MRRVGSTVQDGRKVLDKFESHLVELSQRISKCLFVVPSLDVGSRVRTTSSSRFRLVDLTNDHDRRDDCSMEALKYDWLIELDGNALVGDGEGVGRWRWIAFDGRSSRSARIRSLVRIDPVDDERFPASGPGYEARGLFRVMGTCVRVDEGLTIASFEPGRRTRDAKIFG